MTIGQHINAARVSKGYTLDALAEKSGIPRDTLTGWIYDNRIPRIDRLICVADAMEISVDELVGHELKKKQKISIIKSFLEELKD